MRDLHQNIFYYYRGPSKKKKDCFHDIQVEDNTTKALINLLEFCYNVKFDALLKRFLRGIKVSNRKMTSFRLQRLGENSRPDGIINLNEGKVYIESKVSAHINMGQIRRHIRLLGPNDFLLVVTNRKTDKAKLKRIRNKRLRYVSWHDIHQLCLGVAQGIRNNKKLSAVSLILEDFINYLEVIVMTEFSGFKDEDFDFWVTLDDRYVPILKNKLESLAISIRKDLPAGLRRYSCVRAGNISKSVRDERHAWVAIKKPDNQKDVLNQCNFTIEVSKNTLDVNAVIRNGRTDNPKKPLGIFYEKVSGDPRRFLKIIKEIRTDGKFVIARRLPKTGKVIMPGNERWEGFFGIRLRDITKEEDIQYICQLLRKADTKPASPGIHIRYSIDRGSVILTKPDKLKKEIIATIVAFKPIFDFLER